MPFDFYLEPQDKNIKFPPEIIKGMHSYLKNIPHYFFAEDNTYLIYKDIEDKKVKVSDAILLSAKGQNNYLDAQVVINSCEVVVSAIGDPEVDSHLVDFVAWCQKEFPCVLYENSEIVSPEEILAEA